MGRWKIEVEHAGTPEARYRMARPDAPASTLQLDERETRELMDALIEVLKPKGHEATAGSDNRTVAVMRSKNKLRIRTQTGSIKLPDGDAMSLFEALAAVMTPKPAHPKGRAGATPRTNGVKPAAWQCSRCMATGNAAGPQPPSPTGCQEGSTHAWVRGGVIRLVEAVQQSLPGHTVSIVEDPATTQVQGTSCRVDDPAGDLVGVAVMTDECATTASLDRIEARAAEVARLLKVLRASGDAARYVEVNERGIRIRLR